MGVPKTSAPAAGQFDRSSTGLDSEFIEEFTILLYHRCGPQQPRDFDLLSNFSFPKSQEIRASFLALVPPFNCFSRNFARSRVV